jgi:hypothetical protein
MMPRRWRRRERIFSPPSRWPRRFAVAGLVALAAAILVLVSVRSADNRAVPEAAVDVVHVHGIGVNPVDGAVFLATHTGLYRLGFDGRPTLIGDANQDIMGFTVIGSDLFLASGHPGLRDDRLRVPGKPPLLGLVESRDGGATWNSRSLLGEADFHALAATDGQVYGWNATTAELMATPDMRTWERLSSVELTSFAVDPLDSRRVAAATGAGVTMSLDGGRNWQSVDGSPALVGIAWGRDGITGVDSEGAVHRSSDGLAWEQRALLRGQPTALSVNGDDIYLALDDDGHVMVRRSTDQGRSWKVLYGGAT